MLFYFFFNDTATTEIYTLSLHDALPIWPAPPPIFALLQRLGEIADEEMYRVFNMGIGFALVVAPADAERARARLERAGERVHVLGCAIADTERTLHLRPR